jgi:hypothetical protein
LPAALPIVIRRAWSGYSIEANAFRPASFAVAEPREL